MSLTRLEIERETEMRSTFLLGLAGLASLVVQTRALAQTATYSDVLVVINENSAASDSIGSYFASARSIPSQNIARISVPTSEEIDSLQFEDLRSQVESILVGRGLTDQINFIVTTKGVPLKVKRVSQFNNSSVESELSLILGPYASNIGGYGRIVSPYYGKREDFTRAKFGLYLVTRLDGYTVVDVKAMIDRAETIPVTVPANGTFVLDQDPTWSATVPYLNSNMTKAAAALSDRSLSVVTDSTTLYLTQQTNVLGYVSWGSNDRNAASYTTNAIPQNTYVNGAIAETYVSTSGRTFTSPVVYGQSVIADLIAEGVTAVKGYTYEPYSSAMADVSILFPMYADGYTVAESYYAASYYLSWMDVVVGDPKYRISSVRLPGDAQGTDTTQSNPLPVQLTSFTAEANQNGVTLKWHTATETNCAGFEVERRQLAVGDWQKIAFVTGAGTSATPKPYAFEDSNVGTGRYVYRLKQVDSDGRYEYFGNVEIEIDALPQSLVLSDNYPNPFNPSTNLEFRVRSSDQTKLVVCDMLGRELSVLFDGIAEAGRVYRMQFDGGDFASGTYFAVIESGNQRIVKRMVMVK